MNVSERALGPIILVDQMVTNYLSVSNYQQIHGRSYAHESEFTKSSRNIVMAS